MTGNHRFPYCWKRTDLSRVKKHGHTVFSTFACGGGSSFGYKMAGFDLIGCNEIDKEMMTFYQANHHPKHPFLEPIQTFKSRTDLPDELFNLDVLDGSPPCFVAGTLILTIKGVVPIEMIKEGDIVFTHLGRWRKVTSTMSRMSPTVLVDNRIETTPDHRFYARKSGDDIPEWVKAKDLEGFFLASYHENYKDMGGWIWKKLTRPVVPASELTEVFDFEVEEDHSFVADGYVVHNCSTFSMAGDREKGWGKNKKFREGQAEQVLSDLFFEYLDLVAKLRPKIAVAENVQGMLTGKAKGYCKLIVDRFNSMGYDAQLFLLNAATMGVPQVRERVFFIARRRDLSLPALKLEFNEPIIPFKEVVAALPFQDLSGTDPNQVDRAYWHRTRPGDTYSTVSGGSYFSWCRLSMDRVSPTVLATENMKYPTEMRNLSWVEICLIGSYPYDYDFLKATRNKKVYCIGMSVPPIMMAQIATQIAEQCFGVNADQIDEAWRKK